MQVTAPDPEVTASHPEPRAFHDPDSTPNPNHGDCRRVSEVLSRVGDKWSVLIVMQLSTGPRRFNELKRMIGGISQRMLTLTLRNLERDGLVMRTVTPTIPPRVDYELTALGHSLREPVVALGAWVFANIATIDAARARFDAVSGTDERHS